CQRYRHGVNKRPSEFLGKPTAARPAFSEKILKKALFLAFGPPSQKSFLACSIRLICCRANDDEGGCQSQSGAGSLARASSDSKRWQRRCAGPRLESIHLRHGRAHLQLGRMGTKSDSGTN